MLLKEKIKISVVSYLNSKPFIYGIEESDELKNYSLVLDNPAVCAQKLIHHQVDIGLVPVAIIPDLKYCEILTDYCIGADGDVDSVVLYSDVPLEKIERVWLDDQSKTSVTLLQILSQKYWKIQPAFIKAQDRYEEKITGTTAGVVIGDRTFVLKNKFNYTYDLAAEWKKLTGLPFVFACWVANKELPNEFKSAFNKVIKFGVENKEDIFERLKIQYPQVNIADYLTNKISYPLDDKKKQALKLFLEYTHLLLKSNGYKGIGV